MNKNIVRGLSIAGVLVLTAVGASAAVSADVTTAITAAQTDGTTIVGAMATAGAAVFLSAKVLKKFGLFL